MYLRYGKQVSSRPANRISKQTWPLIGKVVWPIVVPIIAVWETLDFRPSRTEPKEQSAENDCRENSHHVGLVLEKALEPGGHDIGVSTS